MNLFINPAVHVSLNTKTLLQTTLADSVSDTTIAGGKGDILLVDDDENSLLLMRAYLSMQGYRITTAKNGTQAIEMLTHLRPDLIISDVMMPEMDGYDLARMVRNSPEMNWIPILFLSAKDQSSDRVRGLSAGATVYMVKPFDLEELVAQIESSLRSSYLVQQNRARREESRIQVPMGVRLTNTELAVARLVAKGLSNLEIAQQLEASKRTIESHISHMLKKTGLSNRTELSRWMIESNWG